MNELALLTQSNIDSKIYYVLDFKGAKIIMNKFKIVHIIHIFLFAPTITEKKPVPIFGRTRLMKMLFLFERELSKKFIDPKKIDKFDFEAYNFGPFSKKVYEALDFLHSREIIKIENVPENSLNYEDAILDQVLLTEEENKIFFQGTSPYYSERFELTNKGITFMKDKEKWFSWKNLDDEQQNLIVNFKTQMVSTPLKKILRYVYEKYPKYAESSLILQRIGM
ncbi:hypothetical protein ACFLR7_07340 [Acidobacteriota bacterium]